ncbi:MAG TPA: hypothetical protein VHU84_15885 [Lacipirellulaceae bacterium]|jgi:hypothetical protein|nr:hypothetical protein [Lacipirellulaceae bacterium]
MNEPEILNGMLNDMVRRGLPTDYAQRAAAEFVEHHQDLADELKASGWTEGDAAVEASRRLGDAQTFITKTVRGYQCRFWCGRWRIATFLLLPIPTLLTLWLATIAAWGVCLVLPLKLLNLLGPEIPPDGVISTGERIVSCLIEAWFLFVLPMVAMYILIRLNRRAALGTRWLILAAGMLALSALIFTCGFPDAAQHARFMDGRPVPADQFMFTVGMPVPNRIFSIATSIRGARMLLPFAFAGIFYSRQQRVSQASLSLISNC